MYLEGSFLIILYTSLLDTVLAWKYCKNKDGTQFCRDGCCNEGSSDPCCHDIDGALMGVYIVLGMVGCIILFVLTVFIVGYCISYYVRRKEEGMSGGQLKSMTMFQVQTHADRYPPTHLTQPPPYQSPPYTSTGYQPNPKGNRDGSNSYETGNHSTEKQD